MQCHSGTRVASFARMEATEVLKLDHESIRNALDQLDHSQSMRDRTVLFVNLRNDILSHARLKETLFYPHFSDYPELSSFLDRAYEDHEKIKRHITQINSYIEMRSLTEEDALQMDLMISELSEDMKDYLKHQEKELFPRSKKALGHFRMRQLGEFIIEAKEWQTTDSGRAA